MSRSYRRCYHQLACRDEARGVSNLKEYTSRVVRRANKKKVAEAQTSDENEPSKPYLTKRDDRNFYLMTDGKIEANPNMHLRSRFHFKKLAKGKVRMVK